MSPKELKQIVKTMRALGVTHLKTAEYELNLTADAPRPALKNLKPLSDDEEKDIKHKIEQMVSVMKLDDQDLLDRLFPDTTNYGEEDMQ